MAFSGECYMTLVMSDSYLPGAMVLGHSLKDSGTTKELVALVTLDTLSVDVLDELKTIYKILPVDRIPNSKPANLFLMGRPDLLYAFTKIALWRQTQYRKIVYVDADIVALRNLDELFDIEVSFAAAPDIGWPDAFNSGLMVLTPNMGDFWSLQTLAQAGDSFDGADQGLLNQYFEHKPWRRLSFTYNCTPNAEYQWEPAYRYHKSNIKAVHFIGKGKPWFVGRSAQDGQNTYGELVGRWWSVYDRHYRQAPQYVPGKSYVRSTAVQERVWGEHLDTSGYYGVSEEERLPPPQSTDVAPSLTTHDQYVEESSDTTLADSTLQQQHQHAPRVTVQQPTPDSQPFQAPPMSWDATRSAPPPTSRPEAENFPSQHYTFDEQKQRFQAPSKYPEPPKDMWYQVPETKPAEVPPAPIFPWESGPKRATATRVFAQDYPGSPEQEPIGSPQSSSWADSSGGIERYIRDIMGHSHKSTTTAPVALAQEEVTSPTGRRESLLFTGMPAMQDRPSLPVTPAPIMTNVFWGDEEDGTVVLPEALAEQAEWNPEEKLEELRRSSLVEVVQLVKPGSISSPPVSSKGTQKPGSKPGAAGRTPMVRPTPVESVSSDGLSTLELATDSDESSIVAALESAAEKTTTEQTLGDTRSSKKNLVAEADSATIEDKSLRKSPGSFAADTAREEST